MAEAERTKPSPSTPLPQGEGCCDDQATGWRSCGLAIGGLTE